MYDRLLSWNASYQDCMLLFMHRKLYVFQSQDLMKCLSKLLLSLHYLGKYIIFTVFADWFLCSIQYLACVSGNQICWPTYHSNILRRFCFQAMWKLKTWCRKYPTRYMRMHVRRSRARMSNCSENCTLKKLFRKSCTLQFTKPCTYE